MTASQVIEAMGLPAGARLDQRVPKKLLIENGAPTAADKKLINDSVEILTWIAALKPTTIGVPEFRDDVREYLEIAVLTLQARSSGRLARLIELVHRAIPYPLVLMTEHPDGGSISFAHKRWAQNEEGKTVLDGDVTIGNLNVPNEVVNPFLDSLALTNKPRANLCMLYQSWLDSCLALQVASLTGTYVPAVDSKQASARAEALTATKQLEAQIASIQVAAKKEKQISKQVQMNLKVRELRAELSAAKERL